MPKIPKAPKKGPELPADLPVHDAAMDPGLNIPDHDDDHDSNQPEQMTIFLTFITFLGDSFKTAQALNMEPAEVDAMAQIHGWHQKVERLNELREKEGGAAALAREINRTVNYVQAVRLRNMLDRTVRHVTKNTRRFRDFIRQHGKDASNISAKAPLDLVKAVQAVHQMTYAALGDSVSERLEGGPTGEGGGKDQMATDILNALSAARDQDHKRIETSEDSLTDED